MRATGEKTLDQRPTTAMEPSEIATDRYAIDGRASRFTVRAFATGLLASMGHNPTIGVRDMSGEMRFDPDKLQAGSLWITIKASSLAIHDDISAKDIREMEGLMNQEVLETARFPGIKYEAPSVAVTKLAESLYSATLEGNLTLHGVSRRLPIAARVTLIGSMLRASGEFSINQTDFHIKLVSVAGGALKLKDELRLSFEIVARSKE